MNYDTDLTNTIEAEREREELKKSHRTKFIVYICLWFFAGWPAILFSTVLGALIGGAYGAVIFFWLGIALVITFLVLWIYHLIKWLNA